MYSFIYVYPVGFGGDISVAHGAHYICICIHLYMYMYSFVYVYPVGFGGDISVAHRAQRAHDKVDCYDVGRQNWRLDVCVFFHVCGFLLCKSILWERGSLYTYMYTCMYMYIYMYIDICIYLYHRRLHVLVLFSCM